MSQKVSRRDIVRTVTGHLLNTPSERSLWLQRLAAFMVLNKMTGQVDLIVNDIAHEMQLQAGILSAEVVSARQLSEDLRQSITTMLRQQTGADSVVLHETTDQDLLGGFVARTPDAEIDASVRTKLQKLAALA